MNDKKNFLKFKEKKNIFNGLWGKKPFKAQGRSCKLLKSKKYFGHK